MSREEYQRNAVKRMRLAAQIEDPNDKLQLLLMSQAWLKLATFMFDDVAKIVSVVTAEAPKEE